MTEDFNPFEVVDVGGESAHRGGMPDRPGLWTPRQVNTYVAAIDLQGHGMGAIARIPGTWAPSPGDIIQLTQPNRDATVDHVVYQIVAGEFNCVVYVKDSMRANDFKTPRRDMTVYEQAWRPDRPKS